MDSREYKSITQANQFDLAATPIDLLGNSLDPLLVHSNNGLPPASSAIIQDCSTALSPIFRCPRAVDGFDGNSNYFSFASTTNSTEFLNFLSDSQPRADFSFQEINQEPDRSIAVGQFLNEKYADILQASITKVRSSLQQFFDNSEYLGKLQKAFGEDFDHAKAVQLLENYQLPGIEVLAAGVLQGADGAFVIANNTIYLADSLLIGGNSSRLQAVLLEEVGHHIDSLINQSDAAGDEGAIFAELVKGEEISASEYLALVNENDHSQITWLGRSLAVENAIASTFAVKAEGLVTFNGSSDLDGNPLDLSDDALVYAGKGFTFNGNAILPVQLGANGQPVTNSQGKLVLVDKAVSVAAGYLQATVNGTAKQYANLVPPQIIAAQTVDVPAFADIKQQELTRRTPVGAATVVFNASQNPIANMAQWAQKFPPAGTATQPKVVKVIGGSLNVPTGINLSNYIITVDSGSINFNGSSTLSNMVLVANNGNINLNGVQADNLSVLASGTINTNGTARFGGNSLFANGTGDIFFNGATKGIATSDNLRIISAGGLTFNATQATRGSFLSKGNFVANGSSEIYGTVGSKQNVLFNGSTTITYANIVGSSDTTAPIIAVQLANDTGSSAADRLTNNIAIGGTVTDASGIASFTGGFDSTPVSNYVNLLPYLQANGSFSLTDQQVRTLFGNLADGAHTLHLTAKDQFGNQSPVVDLALTIDTSSAAPTAVTLTTDSGISAIDGITNVNKPIFTGKAEAGASVQLLNGTIVLGAGTADASGNWQITSSLLTDGTYSLSAKATDKAGNISGASAPIGLTVDTSSAAPTAVTLTTDSGISAVDGITNVNKPIFTGKAEAGASVQLLNGTTVLGTGTADTSGNWQITSSLLTDGTYSLSAKATDKAGNISGASAPIGLTVDTQTPQLTFSSPVNLAVLKNDGKLVGTLADANFYSLSYRWDNNLAIALSLTAGSFNQALDFTGIPNGAHTLTVIGTDKAGNVSNSNFSVTVEIDNTAPDVLAALTQDTGTIGDRITSNPSITARITDANQVTSVKAGLDTGSLVDVTARRQADGSLVLDRDFWVSIAPAGNLTEGGHTVHLVAEDRFGNRSGIVDTAFTLDSLAPVLQLARDLNGAILNNNSRLQGQATDSNSIASIRYQFDGAPAITLPAGTQFDTPFDFTGINDGAHQLLVTATDIAGNSVSRSYGVTVARGPLVTLALLNDTGSSNTDGITSDINIRGQVADRNRISRLEFSLDNNPNFSDLTVILQLDGTFRLSPTQMNSLAGGTLALGAHSLKVRGVLADGMVVDTATLDFTYQAGNSLVPSLALAKSSDTGVLGDLVTSNVTADLVAKTQAGNTVQLGALMAVADANGVATFSGVALTLGTNSFVLISTNASGEQSTSTTNIIRTNPDDVILTWNHITLNAIRRENTAPPAAARILAMVHTAMFDAVNAIEQKYGVYRVDATAAVGADAIAAAAEAAAKVLASIYPNQQSFFATELTKSLQDGASDADKAAGIAVGDTVAANILAWRKQDGSRSAVSYNPGTAVGSWQPDLPNYDGALYPQWGGVTPFALSSGSQFRPAGGPALTSAEYAQDFAEVKDYGARDSLVRTSDQTQSALFWAGNSGTYTPAGQWNDIAATAASVSGKSLIDNARVFAQLNVAMADAGIAAWDSKYTYNTWRPLTAIRGADRDGNAGTAADPNWLPLLNTPPFPEYVSGHSTFSAAAAAVLGSAFGNNVSFTAGSVGLPDVSRRFSGFEAAAAEAGQSRIYGGIHFQFSNRDGLALGKQIGDYVVSRFMVDDSQAPIAVNLVQDTAAFGATNRDRISQNGAIAGEVRLTPAGLRLQVSVNGGQFVDISDTVGADRKFSLSEGRLATIVGGALTDRRYQLSLQLVETTGAIAGSSNFNFTLDRSAALVQVNTLGTDAVPQVHLTGTVTDLNGGSSGRFKVDGGAWNSFAVLPDGSFDRAINPQGLSAGNHRVELEIADVAGNVHTQAINFTVAVNSDFFSSGGSNSGWLQNLSNGFVLYEGNSLVTQHSVNLVLGGVGKRTIDFDLKASFDKSDLLSVGRDRLAVYIVDSNNQPMSLIANRPAALPLFSLSEGNAEIIPGLVRFDGNHVQIDVSGIQATTGKLVIQLIGQDTDSRSNVQVTNLMDFLDPTGTPGTAVGSYTPPVNPGAAANFTGYLSTNSAQLLLNNVSLDRSTGKYLADLQVQNVGSTVLSRRLAVLLASLPAGVTVTNASGVHPTGSPYLNFETAIHPGGLAAGAISDGIRVEISDPSLVAFTFKPIVLQGASDVVPSLTSLANLTVKVGDKLDIPLQGAGDRITLAIQSTVDLPTGQITGDSHLVFAPAPDQVGTYNFTLIARNGSTETQQAITLNVVADPVTSTRVTGVIADTNQAGLANVLVELSGYQATTDANGKFVIELPAGAAGDTLKVYGQRIQGGGVTYPFIAEKMGLLLGHDIYRGVNNAIERPIFLPLIDVSTGTTVNPLQDTVVTNPKLVGAKVAVAANSLFDKSGNAFAGIMSITEVPLSLTPAALPKDLHPDLVVTVQPGDMVFNTPAKITLPNRAGYQPGTVMDLYSINPNTGVFDVVGKGQVSADGSEIETIEGGVRNSSWHFFGILLHFLGLDFLNGNPNKDFCQAKQNFKSEVIEYSGGVIDDYQLAGYRSQGTERNVVLHYDSLRANPNEIFHIGGSIGNAPTSSILTGKLTLEANGISQVFTDSAQLPTGEGVWAMPSDPSGFIVNQVIDAPIAMSLGHLASGLYNYEIRQGVKLLTAFTTENGVSLAVVGNDSISKGEIAVVNDSNSSFGSGWNISGLQRIIVSSKNKNALLIDGDGTQHVFAAPTSNQSAGFVQSYTSPLGDFSKLERLADGTFRRTTKDGTKYSFDSNGLMVMVVDANGNTTRHVYDRAGNIQQIVDPVGLITTFNYTGNRVTSIVDPAGRTTELSYDVRGNLVAVTDVDNSKTQYGYDSRHLLTSTTDKVGQTRAGIYDVWGRAKTATKEDGTVVNVEPLVTQGLVEARLSTSSIPATARFLNRNLTSVPITNLIGDNPVSKYVDANGNLIASQLDSYGHEVSISDALGVLETIQRSNQNLVSQMTARDGTKTNYSYDATGNVTQVVEQSYGIPANAMFEDSSFQGDNTYGYGIILANGDFNKDGITDIIAAKDSDKSSLAVLLGDGLGGYTSPISLPVNRPINFTGEAKKILVRDVDKDGIDDLVVINDETPISDGGGGYGGTLLLASSLQLASDGIPASTNSDFGPTNSLRLATSVVSSTSQPYTSVQIFTGKRNGSFILNSEYNFDNTFLDAFVDDFDQDGKVDVAIATQPIRFTQGDCNLYVIRGNGDGSFVDTSSPALTLQKTFQPTIATGDFNADGIVDIAFVDKDTTVGKKDIVSVFTGDGGGGFSSGPFITYQIDRFTNGGFNYLLSKDINYDGRADLILTRESGIFPSYGGYADASDLITLVTQADGSFVETLYQTSYARSVIVADLNNDSILDLFVDGTSARYDDRNNSAKYHILLGDGNGSFQMQSIQETYAIDPYGRTLGLSLLDINSDGSLDIVRNGTSPIVRYGSRATSSNNRAINHTDTYTYDPVFNRMTSKTDSLGHRTIYSIDARNGNTLSETRVVGKLGGDDDIVTSYTYTSTGQVKTMIDPLGNITEYTYDLYGNTTAITQGKGTAEETTEQFEYNLAGNQTAKVDENGHRTTYQYNSMNMLVRTIEADPDGTGPLAAPVTIMTYDKMGHMTSVTDPNGHVRRMEYDVRGRLVKTTDANGGVSTRAYDGNGNLTLLTDELNRRQTYKYNLRNRLVESTDADGQKNSFVYDKGDRLVSKTDANDHKTTNVYTVGQNVQQTVDALGNKTSFIYGAIGELLFQIDARGVETRYQYDALGRTVATIDGAKRATRTEYDKAGNVTAMVDAKGNRSEYTYNALNRLVAVKNAEGGITTFNYDKVGNLISVRDPRGNITSSSYDALNRVVATADFLGRTGTRSYDAVGNLLSMTDADGNTTSYQYDAMRRRISVVNPLGQSRTSVLDAVGNIISVADELGRVTIYSYDSLDRLVSTTDLLGGKSIQQYDAVGNVISYADENGNKSLYQYDANDQLVKTIDALGYFAEVAYDSVGNVLFSSDANGNITSYVYDSRKQLIKQTDALGQDVKFTYDAVGNIASQIDELGRTTTYGYDRLNRLTNTTNALGYANSRQFDAAGNVVSKTDANGHKIQYDYDGRNRLVRTTDALGQSTNVAYDARGNLTSVTDARGNTTSYGYNAINRRISVTNALGQSRTSTYDAAGSLVAATDELGKTTSFGRDLLGRLTSITDPLGNRISRQYDAANNLITSNDANGHQTQYQYDAKNRMVKTIDALGYANSVVYDGLDNLLSTTDANGKITSYSYDALNRLTEVTDTLGRKAKTVYDAVGNVSAEIDPLGYRTSYAYDEIDRRTKVTNSLNQITKTSYDTVGNLLAIEDAVGNVTSYTYDANDRLLAETNALGKTRSHAYDAVGNETSRIDRNGRQRSFVYDALNRQTKENWLDAVGSNLRTISYDYDAIGRLTQSNDPDSVYIYGYDLADRLTSVNNSGTAGVPDVLLNYAYDSAGNLISVKDSIAGQQKGTTAYSYDALDRVTRVTQAGTGVRAKRVDMTYDAAGRMTGIGRYGDLAGLTAVASSTYSYDVADRLVSLQHQNSMGTLADYALTYDSNSRITQNMGTEGTQGYAYDSTGQLTGASHTAQASEVYSYDANGNRTNGGYQTGTNNQLLADGTYSYEYDSEGNRTKRTEVATGETTEYRWDYRDRLTGVVVKNAGGNVTKLIEYTYDVADRRIAKKVGGVVLERYIYDGSNIALVFDGQGNQTGRYLNGPGVDFVLAEEKGDGAILWALADNQGSVRDLVNESGAIVSHISYDSFGRVLSRTGNVNFRYGYTGRERDEETGLEYYRARYYDAAVGRFVSEDPIGFGAGDTNLFRYVGNSPTNFIDPTGEQSVAGQPSEFDPVSAAGAVVVGSLNTAYEFGRYTYEAVQDTVNNPEVQRLKEEAIRNAQNAARDAYTEAQKQARRAWDAANRRLRDLGDALRPPIAIDSPKKPGGCDKPIPKDRPIPLPIPQEQVLPDVRDKEKEEEDDNREKKCPSGRILYRGDTREPVVPNKAINDGVFFKGFKGNGPNKDLRTYVLYNPPSVYVGTSTSISTAKMFATNYPQTGNRGYVYAICDPGKGIDVVEELGNDPEFRKRNYHKQREIAFRYGISKENIINAAPFEKDADGKINEAGPYIPNPFYKPK